ncbi:MAG TPA: phosphoribosylformylglycinamidine cyclo-ligase [Thermoanaerobaculia bacterium]|nr:phosphoribosylformylglycinamidine cyclo-ligase [Thermoanaerobaculia bacterium]
MTTSRYADSGVDIDAKAAALARAKGVIRSTFTPGVLGDVGGFGGLFRPDFSKYEEPVLVGSTDGVGTKLKIAITMNRHDTCGADLVNHCVNDILVQGARPLFFLDYIAAGRIDPAVIEGVIGGMARACRENGTALLGGETAEMPGFYAEGEYDVAGTIVGVVDRAKIVDGSRIAAGDVALGLPSVGLQTNGYTLARKVFFETMGKKPSDRLPELGGRPIGDVLLDPHLSYLKALGPVLDADLVHGMAHLTGGGFYDNIPRVLPEGLDVVIKAGAWDVLPVFEVIAREGDVSFEEMHRVFNMGIGMVVFVGAADLARVVEIWKSLGQRWYAIGNVKAGGSRRVDVEPAP